MPGKKTDEIASIAYLVVILSMLYAQPTGVYAQPTGVRGIIFDYLGNHLSKIHHDVAYHLACDSSHGDGSSNNPKKKGHIKTDPRKNIKIIERKTYKIILKFYAKRLFPNLPSWTKPPDTPHTEYIKDMCVLIKWIKYAYNRSRRRITKHKASRLANYYLDKPRALCSDHSCDDAPYCDYIRYCGKCKKMYCYHTAHFNVCIGCIKPYIRCGYHYCIHLERCRVCKKIYCHQSADHSYGCPGSSDDSESSD